MARKVMHPQADALFVSCTALRAALAVPGMEEAIGRPVVTSNQASAWNCLRLCGDDTPRPEFGRLWTKLLAA
jgi:maleate isomerase